jgi:predicted GNAT family acetyltransferase
MTTITKYKTPQDFLNETESLLEERELENNLILGVCNGFTDKTLENETCVFINSIDKNKIQATSIKTISKALIAGTTRNLEHVKPLADFYICNNIGLTGVVGESFYAEAFENFYDKKKISEKKLIVHQLTSIKEQTCATGNLKIANHNDIELLAEWTLNFEEDAEISPMQTKEQILKSTQARVKQGNIFKWVDKDEIVSISAIVRTTKNIGIVGLVYTPDKYRGRGYATTCVQKLSKHILQTGFKSCGLFTDKSNLTSNNIYKRIGYIPIAEFSDLEFEK